MKLIIIASLLVVSAMAKPYNGYNAAPDDSSYLFKYMVKQHPGDVNYGRRESRIGNRVEGMYYVLLPDGRIQKVDYVADENGYRPTVTYLMPN